MNKEIKEFKDFFSSETQARAAGTCSTMKFQIAFHL